MATTITNKDWADLVLQDLNASPNANSEQAILDQMVSENAPQTWTGTAGANNPLNNGLGSGGGSGLGSYPDLTTAAYYAAQEIKNISPSGEQALQSGAAPSIYASDIIASSWSASHYNDGADYYQGPVPLVTSAQSAAAGATGPVVVGSAIPQSTVDATQAGFFITGGSSSKTSSTTVNTKNPLTPGGFTQVAGGKPLTGAGALLTSLDKFMNPTGGSFLQQLSTGFTSDLFASIQSLLVKGAFTIIFIVVAKKGYDALVSSGGQQGLIGQLNGLIGQQNARQRIGIAQQNADTARQEANRKAGFLSDDAAKDFIAGGLV